MKIAFSWRVVGRAMCAFATVSFVTVVPLRGAKFDLDRITPIPDGQVIPASDFYRLPLLRTPRLNRAGTHVTAIVSMGEDKQSLLIMNMEDGKYRTYTGPGNRDIVSGWWLDNDRVVFSLTKEKYYGEGMFVAHASRGGSYALYQWSVISLVSVPGDRPLAPLAWIHWEPMEGKSLRNRVVRLDGNLDLGMGTLIRADIGIEQYNEVLRQNDRHILETYPELPDQVVVMYLADAKGELAYGAINQAGKARLYYLDKREWRPSPLDIDRFQLRGPGEHAGEVLVLTPHEEGKPRALQFMNATTGEPGERVLQDNEYDFHGWVFRHRRSGRIIGVNFERNGPAVRWFVPEYQQIQMALDKMFPDQVVRIVDTDEADRRFLVSTFSDRHPTAYFLVDLEKRVIKPIRSTMPWIDPKRMRPTNILKFKTVDGKRLDAFLTMPEGATKENPPPLVVLPHGGPWVRDDWAFDAHVQFLASRGYAVLRPNYRGSLGYNWMFPAEDQWDFKKMHEDVTAATKTLVASGLIDRNRIAIMGGSFGAYLSLCGLVFEPDLYRCAIAQAGIYDWENVIDEAKDSRYEDARYAILRRMLGDPRANKERFAEISPIFHVQQMKAPILVAHGRQDRVASFSESRRLVNELKKHDKKYETIFFSDEGHGLRNLENEIKMAERIEAFLAAHLK